MSIVGLEVEHVGDLKKALARRVGDWGFDYLALPLVHARLAWRRGAAQFARTDLLLSSQQWSAGVIGRLAPPLVAALTAGSAHGGGAGARAADAVNQELRWAAHVSLAAVCVPPLPRAATAAALAPLARTLLASLARAPHLLVLLAVPLAPPPPPLVALAAGSEAERSDAFGAWRQWNAVRQLCGEHASLGVVLELGADLPDDAEQLVALWCGEPVKALVLPTSAFVSNRHGFPVLSKAHQAVVARFVPHSVQFIVRFDTLASLQLVSDAAAGPRASSEGGSKRDEPLFDASAYHEYIRHLVQRVRQAANGGTTDKDAFEAPYRDVLQAPLQPLQDNLEVLVCLFAPSTTSVFCQQSFNNQFLWGFSVCDKTNVGVFNWTKQKKSQTYETFEKDPVKYRVYEQAMELALREHAEKPENGPIVLMVVGAGRGPLVRAALRAAKRAERRVRIFAVEKNPNAIVTLEAQKESLRDWQEVSCAETFVFIPCFILFILFFVFVACVCVSLI